MHNCSLVYICLKNLLKKVIKRRAVQESLGLLFKYNLLSISIHIHGVFAKFWKKVTNSVWILNFILFLIYKCTACLLDFLFLSGYDSLNTVVKAAAASSFVCAGLLVVGVWWKKKVSEQLVVHDRMEKMKKNKHSCVELWSSTGWWQYVCGNSWQVERKLSTRCAN